MEQPPIRFYLNGKKLGDVTFGYGMEWKQFDVTSIVKPDAKPARGPLAIWHDARAGLPYA